MKRSIVFVIQTELIVNISNIERGGGLQYIVVDNPILGLFVFQKNKDNNNICIGTELFYVIYSSYLISITYCSVGRLRFVYVDFLSHTI